MIKIMWTGPHRILPGIGEAAPDQEIEMEDEDAQSYIAQGLAKEVKAVSKTKKQEDDS